MMKSYNRCYSTWNIIWSFALLALITVSDGFCFSIVASLDDKEKIDSVTTNLMMMNKKIVQDIKVNVPENKLTVVFSDFYRQEVANALTAIAPSLAAELQSPSGIPIYLFSPTYSNMQLTPSDYLEAHIRSNVLPDFDFLRKTVDPVVVKKEMKAIEKEASRISYPKCDPRTSSDLDEFVRMSKEVTKSLDLTLGQHNLQKAKLFIVGGSLETYLAYLKINHLPTLISPDSLSFLQISRQLFRNDYNATKEYLKRMLAPAVRSGEKVVLFDSLFRGESVLTYRKMLTTIAEEEKDPTWDNVVILGAPEIAWEELQKGKTPPLVHRAPTIQEYYNDKESFLEVKVPGPSYSSSHMEGFSNGMKYVFAENQHFIRGKYESFENGSPLNTFLYPERLERDVPPTASAIQVYRYNKLAAILLMLKM
ncbi:MAG: hypothetical protein HQK50_15870 [Oligoflexia bacterium]|nr:hypothetical protein [Oligoflexia bacterium]MBF0367052.1 hypothetical protein [Oligoflexia bacterium]